MHIGILQAGHLPEDMAKVTGDYDTLFRRLLGGHGLDLAVWNVVNMEFPSSVDDADGWLITGSKHGAYDDLPFIPKLEDFVRQARAEQVPLVGICFGHQIIAQALGGRVEKFSGGWSVGPQTVDWGGTPMTLNSWHQDQVIEPPDGAEVLATSDFCRYGALLYDDWAFTVQTHPEFTATEVDFLLRTRAPGLVPEPLRAEAAANLDAPLDNARLADRIANFFKDARHG